GEGRAGRDRPIAGEDEKTLRAGEVDRRGRGKIGLGIELPVRAQRDVDPAGNGLARTAHLCRMRNRGLEVQCPALAERPSAVELKRAIGATPLNASAGASAIIRLPPVTTS